MHDGNVYFHRFQTPRTQKNNRNPVKEKAKCTRNFKYENMGISNNEIEIQSAPKSTSSSFVSISGNEGGNIMTCVPSSSQNEMLVSTTTNPAHHIVESSSSSSVATIQGVPVPLHGKDGNVIGFLLTTTGVTDISNLLPSEIVMLPVQNLTGESVAITTGGTDGSIIGHHHEVASISINNTTSANNSTGGQDS